MNDNLSRLLAAVAIVIAIGGYFFPVAVSSHILGGVTNYDEVDATAIRVGGTNGSRVGPVIVGTAAIIGASTVTATTSAAFDIAITGIVPGDIVQAQLATSTTSTFAGWHIQTIVASSTAGFATLTLTNLTGANANPSVTGIASSTSYQVFHPATSVPGI